MEDNRIQNQIAIYMTNKKLCEFTDKLKPAPIEYYAHMHAQGEEQSDGIRAYSCIGVVLQDYSNGTGDKTVRVTANLSPGFFPFVLSRMDDNKMVRIRRKADLPDVMTMPLVAKTLGCSLTVAYKLLKRDGFPHTVSGQRVYIDKAKFFAWLDAQTQMEKRDHYGWT